MLSPDWVPVPVSAMVTGDPALLASVSVPVKEPAVVGANFTERVRLCEAFTVTGADSPLALKPVPVVVILLIVKAAVPVFEIVTLCDTLLPSATLPKFKFVGLAVNLPTAAAVAVPLSEIVSGDAPALLATEMVPEATPVTVGANLTLRVAV